VAGRKKNPARPRSTTAKKPALLSGGNPQIAKGTGAAPVRAWIAAAPGWKRPLAQRLDALIVRTVPTVNKAVKYNSPLYGVEPDRWFLSLHCFDRYLKVTFFCGAQLDPVPPVSSKMPHVRYFHLHETDTLDEARFVSWVTQASQLPGEKL